MAVGIVTNLVYGLVRSLHNYFWHTLTKENLETVIALLVQLIYHVWFERSRATFLANGKFEGMVFGNSGKGSIPICPHISGQVRLFITEES